MLEKMKKVAAGIPEYVKKFTPAGLVLVLLEMAQKIDALEQKVDLLMKETK